MGYKQLTDLCRGRDARSFGYAYGWKHYALLASSYIAETIQRTAPDLMIPIKAIVCLEARA